MQPFYWGLEYETSLLIYDKNGVNTKVIWKKDRVQITSEVFEKEHDSTNTKDNYFWDVGKRHDSLNQHGIFIIEAQIGVFSGFSLADCYKQLTILALKLDELGHNRRFFTDYNHLISYPVFTYDTPSTDRAEKYSYEGEGEFFLDYALQKPGLYVTDDSHFGYRSVNPDDLSGVPQLTCSFELRYYPALLNLMAKYTTVPDNIESYKTIIDYTKSVTVWSDPDVVAFIMYLVNYYVMYSKYDPSNKDDYFKTYFDVKPRTNPAALFTILSDASRKQVKAIRDRLRSKAILSACDLYLCDIIANLGTTTCVYLEKHIDGNLPGLYTYNETDQELVDAIEMRVSEYGDITGSSCVNMPDPLHKDIKRLPELTYDDETEKFKAGFPIDVWEWTLKNNLVTLELRDFNDLVHISIAIMKQYGDYDYEEDMDISIPTFKKGLELIFTYFFPTLFGHAIQLRREKKSRRSRRVRRSRGSRRSI